MKRFLFSLVAIGFVSSCALAENTPPQPNIATAIKLPPEWENILTDPVAPAKQDKATLEKWAADMSPAGVQPVGYLSPHHP